MKIKQIKLLIFSLPIKKNYQKQQNLAKNINQKPKNDK